MRIVLKLNNLLTNNSIILITFYSHLDVSDTKVHLDILNTQKRSVIVFFLIRLSFEVNFTFHILVITPVFSRTRSFN